MTVFYDGEESFTDHGVTVIGVQATRWRLIKWLTSWFQRSEVLSTLWWNFRGVWWWWQASRSQRFDVCEVPEYHSTPIWLLVGKDKLVVSLHGGKKQTAELNGNYTLESKVLFWLEKLTVRAAGHCYAVSRQQARYGQRTYQRVIHTVIPNPVDTDFFSPGLQRSPDKTAKDFFLFVGRVEPRKGIVTLLTAYTAALAATSTESRFPDLVCIGADWGELGPHKNLSLPKYIRLSFPKSVQAKIKWLPHVSRQKLRRQYRQALACVFPSMEEPFGNVIGEALSCGRVVIASRRAGITEWLMPDQHFYAVSPQVKSIQQALVKVMRGRSQSAPRMQTTARQVAVASFAPSRVVDQVEYWYRRWHPTIDSNKQI